MASESRSENTYYPRLDVLRGISFLMVVCAHTHVTADNTMDCGYLGRAGVGIFFAISGWLITRIILGQVGARNFLFHFYTRRFLRIIPLYYVMILAAALLGWFAPGFRAYFASEDPWAYERLPQLLTFSTEYWRTANNSLPFLAGHSWSLCVEERFYVFWPLLLFFCPRNVKILRVLIAAAIAVWYLLVLATPMYAGILTWIVPLPLLMGCALAIFFPRKPLAIPPVVALPLAFVSLALYIAYAGHSEKSVGHALCVFSLLPGLFAVCLVACSLTSVEPLRNPLARALQWVGQLSYSAYLFHPFFAEIAIKLEQRAGIPWLAPFACVAFCMPVAYLAHVAIERPILACRPLVESRPWCCYLCSLWQVAPILAGLALFVPWNNSLLSLRHHLGW
jgi:peptidoglycan/LPS O-acetylase OafA/YrhL